MTEIPAENESGCISSVSSAGNATAQSADDKFAFGECELLLDDKNRCNIPKKYQVLFSSGGFLTRALNGESLVYYSDAVWSKIKETLTSMDFTEIDGEDIARFLSIGSEVTLDAQSRLTIAPTLRRRANLGKEITLIGMGNKIEIWDTNIWHSFDRRHSSLASLGPSLEKLNLKSRAREYPLAGA